MRRTETPKPIWIKFCMVVDIPDAVKYTNFGDHRLRGFWVAGGQISPSPIDFHRRPYNTLALPCERVMKATRTRHGWVHMFTTHRPTLTLQLHNFDLFRTCRTALLHGNWQDFNWHDASRGPSAIAELLVNQCIGTTTENGAALQ